MIRQDLTPGSANALVAVTSGEGIAFQARTTAGGNSETFPGANVTAPYWVKLVRSSNQFYAYESADGSTWVEIGTETVPMTQTVYVGLEECSKNIYSTGVAIISGVQIQGLTTTANSISDTSVNLIWPDIG